MTARRTSDYCDCLLSAHLDLLWPATPSRSHRAARVSPSVITWGGGGEGGQEEPLIIGILERGRGGEGRGKGGRGPSLLEGRGYFITGMLVGKGKGSQG